MKICDNEPEAPNISLLTCFFRVEHPMFTCCQTETSQLCSYKDVHLSPFMPFHSARKPLSIQTMMLVACLRSPAAAMDKAPWPDLRDTTRKMKTEHESTPLEKENRGLLYSYSPPTVNLVNLHFVGISDSLGKVKSRGSNRFLICF